MNKLLVASALSLSLMVAGASFAADTKAPAADGKSKHHERMHFKALDGLSKDKVELFHSSMKQSYEKDKELYNQIKGLYGELGTITKAEKFDEKAYIAKSAEIEKIKSTMDASRAETMAGFLAKLTPEERAKFADNMKDMHKRHGFHKKEGKDAAKPATASSPK